MAKMFSSQKWTHLKPQRLPLPWLRKNNPDRYWCSEYNCCPAVLIWLQQDCCTESMEKSSCTLLPMGCFLFQVVLLWVFWSSLPKLECQWEPIQQTLREDTRHRWFLPAPAWSVSKIILNTEPKYLQKSGKLSPGLSPPLCCCAYTSQWLQKRRRCITFIKFS